MVSEDSLFVVTREGTLHHVDQGQQAVVFDHGVLCLETLDEVLEVEAGGARLQAWLLHATLRGCIHPVHLELDEFVAHSTTCSAEGVKCDSQTTGHDDPLKHVAPVVLVQI